ASRGVAVLSYVMIVRSVGSERAPKHLLELGPVHPRSQPVRAHVRCAGRVELDRVLHGESAGEALSVARKEPLLVVPDRPTLVSSCPDEVTDDLAHEIGRETVKVAVCRMLDPVSLPVVVDPILHGLVLVV